MHEKINDILNVLELIFDKMIIDKNTEKKLWRQLDLHISPHSKDGIFDVNHLIYIGKYFKGLVKFHRNSKKRLILDLNHFQQFKDKNTYIMLDLFLLYVINSCKQVYVTMEYSFTRSPLMHNGLESITFIRYGIRYGGYIDRTIFNEMFLESINTIDQETFFYKKVITSNEFNDELSTKIGNDIFSTLKRFFKEHWSNKITKVIEEIICNAHCHNPCVCIIDIDYCGVLCDDCESEQKDCCSINISILNLGEKLLYGEIQKKLENKCYMKDDVLYRKIYQAEKKHKEFFDQDYDKEFFYMITAFQKGVSTRYNDSSTSGQGLTQLVENISGNTVLHKNYVISGEKCLNLESSCLSVGKDGLIGFNESGNYIDERPSVMVVDKTKIFFNGTMYQLLLVYDTEDKNDGKENRIEI